MLSNLVNRPGGRISKGQQDEVLRQIRQNERSISVVDLGKDLEEEFVAELCRALLENRFVTTLRLRERELSSSVDPLAALCSRTTTLVTLKISYANLSDMDAMRICGAVIKNKSIQNLSLDHNHISNPDAIALLLRHNRTLDSMDISFNDLGKMGDRAIIAIADALGTNSSLKQLYLSGNGLSDSAARYLLEVVDKHLSTLRLRVLDIAAENSVRSETKQALKLVLDAGRQQASRATEDGDDLRSHLTGMGLTSTAGVLTGAPMPADTEGVSATDVEAWQQQVHAERDERNDEEKKELQARVRQLEEEKEKATTAQIAALEQANRQQQQIAVVTERNSGLQRDLDAVTTKYDKKVKESGEQLAVLQTQLNAVRKELVRQQDAAAADRVRLVELQESMTQELTAVHAQLSAATQANDLLVRLAPPPTRAAVRTERGTVTDLAGVAASNALGKRAAAAAGAAGAGAAAARPASTGDSSTAGYNARSPRRSDGADTWSESTGPEPSHVYNNGPTSSRGGRSTTAPTRMPRDQWMDDDSAHDCKACRREFTITRRKHHCRACGHLFCGSCCSQQKPWDNMRVCTYCLATHTS